MSAKGRIKSDFVFQGMYIANDWFLGFVVYISFSCFEDYPSLYRIRGIENKSTYCKGNDQIDAVCRKSKAKSQSVFVFPFCLQKREKELVNQYMRIAIWLQNFVATFDKCVNNTFNVLARTDNPQRETFFVNYFASLLIHFLSLTFTI